MLTNLPHSQIFLINAHFYYQFVTRVLHTHSSNHCSLMHVVKVDPRNVDAPLNLAQLYYDLRNYEMAQGFYQKTLKLSPSHKEALYKYGRLLHKMAKYEEAVKILNRLVAVDRKYLDGASLLESAKKLSSQVH